MSKIGIDLGTTYTTLCYINEQRRPTDSGYVEVYRPGGDTSVSSVPSVVAYKLENDSLGKRLIGQEARSVIGRKDYVVFQHFKMLLTLEETPAFHEFVKKNPEYADYIRYSRLPSQIATDFLTDLLRGFIRDQAVKNLDKVVVTMPLVWRGLGQQLDGNTGSARHKLTDAIRTACLAVNPAGKKAHIQIKSEPEAAAGYFVHEYRRNNDGKPYAGKILVVDYGGGTLDLTLADVSWSSKGAIELSTLENSGRGKPLDHALGAAGVAYDRKLLEIKVNQSGTAVNVKDTARYLNELENRKKQPLIRDALNEWVMKGTGADDLLFEFRDIEVLPPDCKQAFDTVNRPAFEEAMNDVFAASPELVKSPDLKVVLAGGFSNLAFVEHAVRERIGASPDLDIPDPRLLPYPIQGRQVAIAMGAALVAAQMLDIDDSKTDFQIGFWVWASRLEGEWGWRYIQIIERNTPYAKLTAPCWARDLSGEVIPLIGGESVLYLGYSETGNPNVMPRRMPLNAGAASSSLGASRLSKLVPGWQNNDTQWALGFSIKADDADVSGEAQIRVHFKNLATGQVSDYPVNTIKQFAGVVTAIDRTIEAPFEEAYKAFLAQRQYQGKNPRAGK